MNIISSGGQSHTGVLYAENQYRSMATSHLSRQSAHMLDCTFADGIGKGTQTVTHAQRQIFHLDIAVVGTFEQEVEPARFIRDRCLRAHDIVAGKLVESLPGNSFRDKLVGAQRINPNPAECRHHDFQCVSILTLGILGFGVPGHATRQVAARHCARVRAVGCEDPAVGRFNIRQKPFVAAHQPAFHERWL